MNETGNRQNPFRKEQFQEYGRTLRRDFHDIKEFYLDNDQKVRLEEMKPFRRWIFLIGWISKSLFKKLNPLRRMLLVVAAVFLFLDITGFQWGNTQVTLNFPLLGGLVLIFILMLELKDKLLARTELAEGRAIQTRLLPETSPSIPGWDAWLFSRPANDVGGDLLDIIRFSDTQYLLVLGDVSGKGLPAALLMAKLQATIRALADATVPLEKLGTRINEIFRRDGITGSFATLVVLGLERETGKITMFNAGHTPPVFIYNGTSKVTEKGDTALGLLSDSEYRVSFHEMERGEMLVIYSDGINEARNEQGECYDNPRLLRLLEKGSHLSAADIGVQILSEVQAFIGETRPDDDQTLLILKRLV